MGDESSIVRLQAKVELITWLIDRECVRQKKKCAEHFRHMEQLRFEYKLKIEEYEKKNK